MNNLVTLNQDNQATTTSKVIAETFDKEHRHVMANIRKTAAEYEDLKLTGELDESVGVPFFGLSYYISDQNKELPCYELNRDAFNLVVMGFTGSKVMKFKLRFIGAFNKMEEFIKSGSVKQLSAAEQIAEETAVLEATAAKEAAEQHLYQVRMKGAHDSVQMALDMAKLFNSPIDINDLIDRDLSSVPAPIITDLKMKLAPQINQFGSLDLKRSSLGSLLEKHGVDMSAAKFNADVLRPLSMLSGSNEIQGAGLYFGSNDVASSAKDTTHPRWFVDRFPELLTYIKEQMNISL